MFFVFAVYLALLILAFPHAQAIPDPQPIERLTVYSKTNLNSLEVPNLKSLDLAPIVGITPPQPNTYEPGNCTFGVASWVNVPDTLGNANTWDDRAADMGYVVTDTPIPGAVGQSDAGYYGHVVLVEEVKADEVLIKEMNSLGLGVVDEKWVPVEKYNYIYF